MSQLLIRNISPETLDCLKNRAKLHNRSLQGEVKSILEEVANSANFNESSWPPEFLKRIIGGWQGEELVRPKQGNYEQRDELE